MRRRPAANTAPTLFDAAFASEGLTCGVDEAGRGSLAGPVVAAAVILDPARPVDGLRDSKKLTARQREAAAQAIRERALAWAIGEATVEEIDEINILQATLRAMARAVAALRPAATRALIDGNQMPTLAIPGRCIIGGDDLAPAISAASILAKTHRDALLCALDDAHPGYGFARHAGYGTALHLQQLRALGACAEHRRSFAPVREAMCERPG